MLHLNKITLPEEDTMRKWPLLYQILAVNSAIVFIGAAAGTTITRTLAQQSSIALTVSFASLGLLLSIAANYVLLRLALRPLLVLQTVSELVAEGDLTIRAEETRGGEPNLARLAHTFNTMLDRLEEDTLALEHSRQLTEQLTQQVLSAQEEERRRIARELHDETAQSLATLGIYIDTVLSTEAEHMTPGLQNGLRRVREVVDRTLGGVRTIIADLRPSLLDDLGLAAALRWQAQHRLEDAGIRVDLQIRGEGRRLSPQVETALYRILQEAITNILKYAEASYVEIDLDLSQIDLVTARIEDNGRGFDSTTLGPTAHGQGVGIFGMQERANLVGGTLQIDSAPGEGTEVRVSIPFNLSLAFLSYADCQPEERDVVAGRDS
jgi:two-component system, NarL family, sensor histidine kinase UhpB